MEVIPLRACGQPAADRALDEDDEAALAAREHTSAAS